MAFVPIDREFFRSVFWLEDRAYSEAEAYIDLLQRVRVDASPLEKLLPNGRLLTVNRHEVHASLRYLASQWKWSTKKVKRFLDILEKKQYLKRRTQHQETILCIENTSVSLPNNSKRETLKETAKETLKKHCGNSEETNIKNEENVNNEENGGECARIPPPPRQELAVAESNENPPSNDCDAFKDFWNRLATENRLGMKITSVRWLIFPPDILYKLQSRLEEYGLEVLKEALILVGQSDYWQGKSMSMWQFLETKTIDNGLAKIYGTGAIEEQNQPKKRKPKQSVLKACIMGERKEPLGTYESDFEEETPCET